ncbi:MAG: 4-hydroxy-tetrahydrodipicolinate synthase [Clostridia bacterium]|nr:4-hydroxy-tetrahydrodipicolinate synthase [Clostridia bacterium]
MSIFKGCATAIITPFDKNNKINFTAFKKLVDFQIENGVNALVFLGTTGEASTLTEKEKLQVAKFAISYVKGRVPVILGAGGNNTAEVIERSKRFAKLGADALLQITPYYNKCTQDGLVQHFTAIAKAADGIPQILYNVPSRTGVNMLPETVQKLAAVPNIVGIKEAGGNLQELARILPEDFDIFSGKDEQIFTTLALGGSGVISVVSNVAPAQTTALCNAFFEGNIELARKIQFELVPLIRTLFCEVNPIPVKAGIGLLGFDVGTPRLPLTPATEGTINKLKENLNID